MKEYIVPVGDKGNMAMIENELHLQELVRCKECKHFDGIDCKINDIVNIMNTDWFCADGERK